MADANDPATVVVDPVAFVALQDLVQNLTAQIAQIEANEDQDARNLNSVCSLNFIKNYRT